MGLGGGRWGSLLLLATATLAAQSIGESDWQKAAGGKMTFEVASVKPSKSPRIPNFPLDPGNAKTPGGRFSAAMPLYIYIDFAYKLAPNPLQERTLTHLAESVRKDFYDIEARAPGNPTKDQMRLMVQVPVGRAVQTGRAFRNARDAGIRTGVSEAGKNWAEAASACRGSNLPGGLRDDSAGSAAKS
jgi:hypothetical protein